ncbi:hypothetical protein B0H10DRAFT_1964734 [Mycena sp. CBHHK59/15]|nr:hypothetical protein B0H10DRAFT_1964734 [Mycena sp. CBHHK59/15]
MAMALALSESHKVFVASGCCVLGDLSKCEPLLELVPTLASDNGFHVFVASHTEQDIQEAFGFLETILLQIEWLQHRPHLARLSEEMQGIIRETLSNKASGMFRLVQCQLDLLGQQHAYKSLMSTLQNLPTTLLEMYDHILECIEDSGEETAAIAHWITAELAEAIMIEPCCMELNTYYLVTSNTVILKVLSSLVIHEAHTDVVNLSHFSVLEYLMSSYLLESPFSSYHLPVQPVLANKIFALIIDYVLMDDFNHPLFEVEDKFLHFFDQKHPLYRNTGDSKCWKAYFSFVGTSLETFEALLRFIHVAETPGAAHSHLQQQSWATNFTRTFQNRIDGYYHGYHPLPWLILQRIHPSFIECIQLLKLQADLIQCCLFTLIWSRHTLTTEMLLDSGSADDHQEHLCLACQYMVGSMLPVVCSPLAFALKVGGKRVCTCHNGNLVALAPSSLYPGRTLDS